MCYIIFSDLKKLILKKLRFRELPNDSSSEVLNSLGMFICVIKTESKSTFTFLESFFNIDCYTWTQKCVMNIILLNDTRIFLNSNNKFTHNAAKMVHVYLICSINICSRWHLVYRISCVAKIYDSSSENFESIRHLQIQHYRCVVFQHFRILFLVNLCMKYYLL